MTKTRTKIIIMLIFTPILIILLLGMVLGLSQFLTFFQKGADPASIFRGHELMIPEDEQAVWLSTAPIAGVSPSRSQQEELISAYWEAWLAVSRAYETGLSNDLSTYWASPILETLSTSIIAGQEHQTSHHELSLLFFSDDRSVAQLQDDFLLSVNGIETSATATITLTLDTGRWRIRFMTLAYNTNN